MLASSRVDKQSKKTIAQLLNQRELSRPDESDDSDDEEEEPHPQKTSLGSVHREPAKPAKKPPAASRTPVASCTYILIFQTRRASFATFTRGNHDAEKTDRSNVRAWTLR